MNLHLVGGFLGSGKTTAIINAAKALMEQGQRVGVITNDQGKYLVDTAFFRMAAIPTLEVTGGCFCCNYQELNNRLLDIIAASQPDVAFAESVGSCADIVATVVKPLLKFGQAQFGPASFSVFTDARLLHQRLLMQEMPFSDDIVYIFDKQIEEAGLLVVNKADLVTTQVLEEIQALLTEKYPGKPCLFQSSLTSEGVQIWLNRIQLNRLELPGPALEIDYARYGNGEARLAWFDEEVVLRFPAGQGRALLKRIIDQLHTEITERHAGIGHLKFIVSTGLTGAKISFPAIDEPGTLDQIPEIEGGEVTLLVNARVEMPAEELRGLIEQVIEQSIGGEYTIRGEAAFHPPQPKPTYRMD